MIGCFTSKSISTNHLMRPADRIKRFGPIKGENWAIRLLRLTGLFSRSSFLSALNDSPGQDTGDDARLRQAPWGLWCYHRHYGNIREKVTSGVRTLLSVATSDKNCTYRKGISCGGGSLVDLVTDAANNVFVSSVSLVTIPSLMLLTTSLLGSNGNYLVLKKSRPLTQLLDCKTSADIPWVPASAALSVEATWFHSSTLVCSKTSHTRFATNIGCLLVELSHYKTVVLSVHIKTLLICTVGARQMSCFNRAASSAACSSSFGTAMTFIGATRALPRRNASAVWGPLEVVTRARRNATALKTSCELSPNKCSSRCSKFPEK